MNTIESSNLTARACDEIDLLRKALEGIYNISEHANTALIWIQMEDINWNISNKMLWMKELEMAEHIKNFAEIK